MVGLDYFIFSLLVVVNKWEDVGDTISRSDSFLPTR